MKIGYSAWGFVGDGVLDSPDGGRLTRSLFLSHLIDKGHSVVWLQKNRDVDLNCKPLFSTSQKANYEFDWEKTRLCDLQYDESFPNIDILFLEWRWPLTGRNFFPDGSENHKFDKNYTPDLDRQKELLTYYAGTNTRIVIWDKDETMTPLDEYGLIESMYGVSPAINIEEFEVKVSEISRARDIVILSPALFPIKQVLPRSTLLFPCDLAKIRGTRVNDHPSIKYLIGYVGSQYDRDEQVYKYINPFAFKHPQQVIFAGNWMKYPDKAKRNEVNFPCISFTDRILPRDMWKIYRLCLTSVLLCKQNYAEHGHITQRIHEVAANGVIAIGLKEQKGIERFILEDNIVSDAYDLEVRINYLWYSSVEERQQILDKQIEMLEPFDIKNVIAEFEKLCM
jgi:hypothetical protein